MFGLSKMRTFNAAVQEVRGDWASCFGQLRQGLRKARRHRRCRRSEQGKFNSILFALSFSASLTYLILILIL